MRDGLLGIGITKVFNGTTALDAVDLRAPAGSITAITGSNGAGKTTLLKVFATLLRPDAGSATVDGLDPVTQGDEVRRRIGVALVNERSLYWRLSAHQNLLFFARASGLDRKAAARNATTAMEALGMGELAVKRVDRLSAGQRQRLNLARAIIAEPSVLLVDEPLRGLDDEGIAGVRDLLVRIAKEGRTVVVAGPTMTDLEDLCASVVRLERGRVTEVVGA